MDRSGRHNLVQQCVDEFGQHERMMMLITPKGTRKGQARWKTGFYHIATGAQVPILCGILDYQRKIAGPGLLVYPSGDMVSDLCRIRDFYADMPPRHVTQLSDIWVPGMEPCPDRSGNGYRTWLAANAWVTRGEMEGEGVN